jgi:hypothetical protein
VPRRHLPRSHKPAQAPPKAQENHCNDLPTLLTSGVVYKVLPVGLHCTFISRPVSKEFAKVQATEGASEVLPCLCTGRARQSGRTMQCKPTATYCRR